MKLNEKFSLAILIASASAMATFISPALVSIKGHFNVSINQLSMAMTWYLIGYLLGQIVWAYYSSKKGRIVSIRHGVMLSLIGAIAVFFGIKYTSYSAFIIGRFLIAFGLSSGLVCGFAIVKECLTTAEEKKFLPIITIILTSSMYASTFASSYLMQFNSLGLIGLAILLYNSIALVLSYIIKPYHLTDSILKLTDIKESAFRYNVVGYSIVLSISTIIAYCYAFYAPIITNELYYLEPKEFGIYNLLNMICIFIGSFLYIRLNRLVSEFWICLLALSIIIVSVLPLCILNPMNVKIPLSLFYVLFGFINIACGLIYPAATYLALKHGNCKITSSAIMNLIKLSFPVFAIVVSSKLFNSSLESLCGGILLFSLVSLISLFSILAVSRKKTSHFF